jgi:hypothetical protein
MRPDLQDRIARVASAVHLLHRIADVSQIVDRSAEQSKKWALKAREQMLKAVATVAQGAPEDKKAVFEQLMQTIKSFVPDSGVIDREAIPSMGEELKSVVEQHSPPLFQGFLKFIQAGVVLSRLQDVNRTQLAKNDPRYTENFEKAQQQFAGAMKGMLEALSQVKAPEAPAAAQPAAPAEEVIDPEQLKSIQNQLEEVEADMKKIVAEMVGAITKKLREVFIKDEDFRAEITDNISAFFHNNKVDPRLNRSKQFYEKALHLEMGDVRDHELIVGSDKNKKALYSAYKSLVMAARSLGIVQYAKQRPELVLKSPRARELVLKAQKILQKRRSDIIEKLSQLKHQQIDQSPIVDDDDNEWLSVLRS